MSKDDNLIISAGVSLMGGDDSKYVLDRWELVPPAPGGTVTISKDMPRPEGFVTKICVEVEDD